MAECWCVVGHRKMSCAVTGERNKSNVGPGLGLLQYGKSRICHTAVKGNVVLMTSDPTAEALVRLFRGAKFTLSYFDQIGV